MSESVKTADGRVLDAVEVAALDGIAKRLTWPSMHWGTEAVSSEAWPHIAIAAAAAVREQIAAEILSDVALFAEIERACIDGAGNPSTLADRVQDIAALRIARGGAR